MVSGRHQQHIEALIDGVGHKRRICSPRDECEFGVLESERQRGNFEFALESFICVKEIGADCRLAIESGHQSDSANARSEFRNHVADTFDGLGRAIDSNEKVEPTWRNFTVSNDANNGLLMPDHPAHHWHDERTEPHAEGSEQQEIVPSPPHDE